MSAIRKIDVVFTSDSNYIQHFCVAVTSLLDNNLKYIDRVFLLTDINNKEPLEKTFGFIYLRYEKRITCITIDSSIIKRFKIDGHISQATYFRLFLSEI